MIFGKSWRRWTGKSVPRAFDVPQPVPEENVPAPASTPASPAPDAGLGPAGPAVRAISSIEELDAVLKEVEAAHAVSHDAVRAVLDSFRYVVDVGDLPPDPHSVEYNQYQLALYRRIAERPYRIENERTSYLSGDASALPFPYCTQSWKTVSDHVVMLGLIIRTLALAPGASILEFGPGFGNTTLALAQMGYQVTAVDIEQRFLDIIGHRCRDLAVPPRLLCRDFAQAGDLNERFDAILFYESFHHSSDHQALLASLPGLLKPEGKVLFAAEPIHDMPMPWGLRLDGMSVWSTRCFGWLELGFTEPYFREALKRAGFAVEKVHYPVTDIGTIFVARPEVEQRHDQAIVSTALPSTSR
jgi:2-polyprenyl-3-methyl-5-hydroxy-6-metoxy-1,4-benzoquinol methylase